MFGRLRLSRPECVAQVTLAHVMNPVRIFHRDEMFEAMVSDLTYKTRSRLG